MIKGVLAGLTVLVLAVFAYIGYSIHGTGSSANTSEVYSDGVTGGRTRTDVRAEPGSGRQATTLPAMPTTGEPTGVSNGMVAQDGAGPASRGMTPPATDSIAPNPPNGMTFGGSGHFQLYRQGDLTWRMNTDTGETCVIFATDEEWRKPKVYRAGCRGK